MTSGRDDRPRDDAGRPQSDRLRDALGRPLPRDAPPDDVVPRESEDVVRAPHESIARAQSLLDSHQPFNAHDVLEAAWKHGPVHERDLWQGLAQLCVALTHVGRGNPSGARTLFARGASRLRDYQRTAGDAHGVALASVIAWATEAAAVASDAELPAEGLQLTE